MDNKNAVSTSDIKESIERLSSLKQRVYFSSRSYNFESIAIDVCREEVDSFVKDMEAALVSLNKQIPKSPIIESWCPARCPCCDEYLSEDLGDGYYKHYTSLTICDCGQKLIWQE